MNMKLYNLADPNDTKAWIIDALPDVASSILSAAGEDGLISLAAAVHKIARVTQHREIMAAEDRAKEVAKDLRTKVEAYEAGFKAAAGDAAYSKALVQTLDSKIENLTSAAADHALARATEVFKVLAGDDPRLSLALNLLTASNMEASAIVAAVQTIPEHKDRGSEWKAFMAKNHAQGAAPDHTEVEDAPTATSQPSRKKKDAFLTSIGITAGTKRKSALATTGGSPRLG